MTLSEELIWRGFYNQTTFEAPTVLDTTSFTLYLGTDPSGDSLHVGHLAVYMMVRRFLDHGHKVILLVGGGTGMIGDMRDTEERELKPLDEIEHNKAALAAQVSKLFSKQTFELVDNYDWLKDIELLPFLRDIGKAFTMNELTSREFYKSRTDGKSSGLSYAEFSYTILQGYDFLHLHREKGVNLQIGGSDQWGNLLSGVELIRKKTGNTVYALSSPLIVNKSTGRKFGKSEGGQAVWLDDAKTSVYQFYQFWFNVDDESAINYLKLFTMLEKEQIDAIAEAHQSNPGERLAQKTLAREVTDLVHGSERRTSVERVTNALFGGAGFETLSIDDVESLSHEVPTVMAGKTIVEILVEATIASSNGEARRLLEGGAITINGHKKTDDIVISELSLLKKGKNSFVLIR
jgi:tyrosyl-tRNA synthetase